MQTAYSELGLHLYSREKLHLARAHAVSLVRGLLLILCLEILLCFYVYKGNGLVCYDYILC